MKENDIIEAWAKIRKIDHTIPDEVLDFMKEAAVQKLSVPDPKIKWLKSTQEIQKGNVGDFILEFPMEENTTMSIILQDHIVTDIISIPIEGGVVERIEFKDNKNGSIIYEERSYCRKIIVKELYG